MAETFKKTTESIANFGAQAAGAVSGSLSLGAGASSKKTTTTKTTIPADEHQQVLQQGGAGQPAQGRIVASQQKQISSKEADALYEERIEEGMFLVNSTTQAFCWTWPAEI
jgi:hypothetical protein